MSININPKHKGKFTKDAKKHHKTVSEFIKSLLKPGSKGTAKEKEEANFAKNAKNFHH